MTTKNFVAPSLPLPPPDYDQRREDQFANALRIYFNQLDSYLASVGTPQYGTTLERPATLLQIGQFYFDTTLGYPIWYDGTDWVDAAGTVV